jgi:hypothetical protein
MSELVARRADAEARVEQLEAEQLAAAQARIEARAALVESERIGARTADRTKLERALGEAESRPNVLAARIEGARQAVRDAEVALARHVQGHLTELVERLEAEGEAAAKRLDAAAEQVVARFRERDEVAAQISQLASLVGRVRPGDVTFTRAEAVAHAASQFISRGGEQPPRLERQPNDPRHSETAPARSAA